jgi:hypothetical protein
MTQDERQTIRGRYDEVAHRIAVEGWETFIDEPDELRIAAILRERDEAGKPMRPVYDMDEADEISRRVIDGVYVALEQPGLGVLAWGYYELSGEASLLRDALKKAEGEAKALREALEDAAGMLTELIGSLPCERSPDMWQRAKDAYHKARAALHGQGE